MKNLFYLLLVATLYFSCTSEENVQEEDMMEEEESKLLCENSPLEFTVVVNGITLNADSCWFVYIKDPAAAGITGDYPAVIKWRYPGYPEWDGANSLSFDYSTESVVAGESYKARNIIGIVQFDGSAGEMFQDIGEETITINIQEFNPESEYICGDFEGKALFTDYSVVEFTGTFKGVLNPE